MTAARALITGASSGIGAALARELARRVPQAAVSAVHRGATSQDIVDTAAMLLVMGTIAVVVYDHVGLAFLRSAWINLDAVWAGALIVAGLLSLVI